MNLLIKKEYKNSVKFVCKKCKRVVMVKKGSPCHLAGKCGSCWSGERVVE